MIRLKKFLSASRVNVVLFTLVVSLILFASIGATRATLSYLSLGYGAEVQMQDIGVSLLENGERVSWRDYDNTGRNGGWEARIPGMLLANMLPEGETLTLDKTYREELSVRNSGSINQYVRVSIYRYWIDPNQLDPETGGPKKLLGLDPSMIDLHLVNLGSYWIEDESARTNERIVLYYNRLLHSSIYDENDMVTPLFADTLTISGEIADEWDQITLPDGTVQTVYAYADKKFILEVHVDAVQENNAQDAILSAWGRNVVISNGTLSLQ